MIESQNKLDRELDGKIARCRAILREMERVVVAFSGGVDSSLLLALATDTLGADNVLAGMGVSTIFPQREVKAGRDVARHLHVEMAELETPQLADAAFAANPGDRCYYCKTTLLCHLKDLAESRGFAAVVTGANLDDQDDYRPGSRAEDELGVRRPLREAGMTKRDVRAASRMLNLPTWDAPSAACLATRIPYGEQITEQRLQRIERAEDLLHEMGFRQLRVRDHDAIARIEVPTEDISRLAEHRDRIVRSLKALGYQYVSLDLQGFRSGSMNEPLHKTKG